MSRVGFPRSVLGMAAAIASVSLAGCVHTASERPRADAWNVGGPDRRLAASQGQQRPVPVETEADGLPAQTPPSMRKRPLPDDPREPFSRNYGGPPASVEPGPQLPASQPHDVTAAAHPGMRDRVLDGTAPRAR